MLEVANNFPKTEQQLQANLEFLSLMIPKERMTLNLLMIQFQLLKEVLIKLQILRQNLDDTVDPFVVLLDPPIDGEGVATLLEQHTTIGTIQTPEEDHLLHQFVHLKILSNYEK